jgi:Zn-dependent peptidase ImmA (M78 family)/transcriptional regulator with XRE-family HTH domain
MTAMSATDVAPLFDGARLTLARQLAKLRKSDLAKKVDKSPTAVSGWESGDKRPSAATIAELALALGIEAGFFVARDDRSTAPGVVPHFRSLRSTTQIAREQATAYGHITLDITSALERHVEFPDSSVPSWQVSEYGMTLNGPEEAARATRRSWELKHGPVGHLIRLQEHRGVVVVYSPIGALSVDAYSFDNPVRPVIILNPAKRDYYRQRFDAAHELGHLVMHTDAEPGSHAVEEQANRFAAEFLMPEEDILPSLPTSMGHGVWADVARLKEQWGVSMQALLFRARRLGCLGDVSYRNAMVTLSTRGWRRQEPGLVNAMEQPSMLPRAVELLGEHGVTREQLIAQCRVPRLLFDQIVSRVPLDGCIKA